jgi:hypothetical protein
MNRSEQINELATALAKAQGEMKAALKNALNPAFKRQGETGGTKYAALPDVFEAARVLSKHGLSFVQPASVAEDGAVTVETMLMHSSGQWLSEKLSLRPQANTPQGIGSAMTYGRRYGLSSLVGIAADEDDDGNEASAPTRPAKPRAAPPEKQTEVQKDDPAHAKSVALKDKILAAQTRADLVKLDTEAAELHKTRQINDAQHKRLGEYIAARLKDIATLQENAA